MSPRSEVGSTAVDLRGSEWRAEAVTVPLVTSQHLKGGKVPLLVEVNGFFSTKISLVSYSSLLTVLLCVFRVE